MSFSLSNDLVSIDTLKGTCKTQPLILPKLQLGVRSGSEK